MDLQVPIPSIDIAVSCGIFQHGDLRQQLGKQSNPERIWEGDRQALTGVIERLFFNLVLIYSQGMHLLSKASAEYGYRLNSS